MKQATQDDKTMLLAQELDAALARKADPERICQMLRTMDARPQDVFAEMLNAWRIFSADFRFGCNEEDCRLIYALSDEVPSVVGENYYRQVRGMRMVEARRRASMTRGRVNIRVDEPFLDVARHEVHDIFSRKDTVEGYARSLASLPNLGANDIATTMWAGRIYQDDFFRLAPQRLKLKMLEHLHGVDAIIAQPFVAQLLGNRTLPRRYRVLAWAEGVLRPHDYCNRTNAIVKRAYAASKEERHRKESQRRLQKHKRAEQGIETLDWLVMYSGGDSPARFDMERTLRGFELSWQIIGWIASHSLQNVMTYYIMECQDELSELFSSGELAAYLCGNGQCSCAIPLLQSIEKASPGLLAGYLDANGANLLEHLLYRYEEKEPDKGGWLRMCFRRGSEIHALESFLKSVGCEDDVPNSAGITWADIKDAASERFDGSVFREILAEDGDGHESFPGLEDLLRHKGTAFGPMDEEEWSPNG